MHEDCFAFGLAYKNGEPYCKCLLEMFCGRESGKCSFFKTKTQFNIDLARHNGTTDLAKLSKCYAETHGISCSEYETDE